MATLSLYLFVAGGLALAFAFACHVVYTTILAQSGVAVARRRMAPAAAAIGGGTATVPFGGPGSDPGVSRGTESSSVPGATSGAFAISATWVAAALIGLSMILRAVIVGRGPWGNMYEFSVAFGFGITAGYLFLQRRYAIRSLGFLPLGVAVFLVGYAATLPHQIEPLVPALDNAPLLTVHVAMAMISYGIFATAFGAAVAYLAQGPHDRFAWLPPHKTLDEVAYRAVIIGFPIFATMIILGSWWASIAWGRYWGWDPKETSALVTWLIYAVYLHARNARGWAGRPAAMILVIGFAAVLFTYFGNLYFSGLHAYSGLD
jgi:cytochrome c-type biogenesis protein CcsB